MKTKILSILALLLTVTQGAWAASVNCLPSDIGKVLGTDGKVYATVAAAGGISNVSGMIAYVNGTTGIAIGPSDLLWNSSDGSQKMPVSTAISACNGYGKTRPSAATTGWRLPSQADFNNMIGSSGCESADNLRNMIGRQASSCGCYAMNTDEGYWSSTLSGSGVYYNLWATNCNAVASQDNEKYVRPCFTFNVTPNYTATFADGNDNTGWDIDHTSGVEGATVTVSYKGENKVKSVTVKGISAVTSAPTANDLTYTGSAQALVTAGTATYGTMVYSLDGETYSDAIPTATNAGDYTVYYKVDGGTDYTGTTAQTVDVTIGYYIPNTSEAVDLGLSVKWAPFNVGAKTATEYGLYYAWADTEGHYAGDGFNLSWNTTPYYNGSTTSWTKYGSSPATLDSSDDAAAVNWGSSWRMPTETEYRELISNTTQTWQSNYQGSGVSGYLLTSTKAGYTDKSIFISDAGCRSGMDLQNWGARYWSSSLSSDGAQYGMGFRFPGDGSQKGHVNKDNRNLGFTVRAVCPK